jgi:uncharacterized membrane-anchored protein YhcB (DUF1043 family)
MALTAEDLRDLVALLQAHPEWREPLWALLASEEVRRMPADLKALRAEVDRRFAELAEAQRRTEESLQRLSEAFVAHRQEFLAYREETDRRFAELAEAQRRTEESLQRLSEAFAAHRQEFLAHREETDRRFAELAEAQRRHYQEFAAHRQEFLAYREETDRRFAELAEAQRRHYEEFAAYRAETDRRFAELAEAQRRHYEEFAAYRAETDRRFAELAEALRVLTQRVDRVERRLEDHSRDLGELKSMRLEALYAENPALFRSLLRQAAIVPGARRLEILEQAESAGRITEEEADRAAPLDALVEGFHRREDRRVYLAVEISWLGGTKDVGRAAERAAIFARALGAEVIPVVAAKELTVPARRMARDRGVWWLQDGRALPPEEIPEEGPESEEA